MNNTTSELSRELRGQIDFGRINFRNNPLTARKYKVSSYPTLLFFDEGVLVDRIKGKMTKSELLAELKDLKPDLNTSNVKLPPVNCANMSKSDEPLLEAFIVSECPFGLQMQRIMADIIGKAPDAQKFMKVRYIGSVSNNTISSMHGEEEAQENLRQICIREEQANKYWSYVGCYMKEGKSSDCLKSSSIDEEKVNSCMKDPQRGVAFAQEDFDLADKMSISGSPTIYMNGKIVSEFDFATDTINARSPEALKNMLCCAFKIQPTFCTQELNKTQAMTMFSVKAPSAATTPSQATGRDIALISLGEVNPSQPMLITDDTMNSAISQYPLLVVQGFVKWCGYCRNMNVTISELSEELQGQAAFGLIDIDSNNKTKAKYNITAYPTMLIFKDGELIETVIGYQQKSTFADKLKQIEPT